MGGGVWERLEQPDLLSWASTDHKAGISTARAVSSPSCLPCAGPG